MSFEIYGSGGFGFSYRGVHSEVFGMRYIPDASDLMKANTSPDYSPLTEAVTGRDGSYYYGNKVKERTFKLACFFENVTKAKRANIDKWLDRNSEGELIFDDRPFVKYKVRPSKIIDGKAYLVNEPGMNEETFSGTCSIEFTAYDPFGYMRYDRYEVNDYGGASQYCGIMEARRMPSVPATPLSGTSSFLLYNPGTQECDTLIKIGGAAPNGVKIRNLTNGKVCTLKGLPASGILELDSYLGTTEWVNGLDREFQFEWHDDGYLRLDSYGDFFLGNEAFIFATANSKNVEVQIRNSQGEQDLTGLYFYYDGAWNKLLSKTIDGKYATHKLFPADKAFTSELVRMNEIEISGDGMNLTTLEITTYPKIY